MSSTGLGISRKARLQHEVAIDISWLDHEVCLAGVTLNIRPTRETI